MTPEEFKDLKDKVQIEKDYYQPSPFTKSCDHDKGDRWNDGRYAEVSLGLKKYHPTCPFCPTPKEKEDRTVEEIAHEFLNSLKLWNSVPLDDVHETVSRANDDRKALAELLRSKRTRPSKQDSEAVGVVDILISTRTTLKTIKTWAEETCRLNRDSRPFKMVADAEAKISEISQILDALEKVRGGKP